ncbi:MAG: molecular chaperone HtpG [Proteobacteria bacterium]|nr:molecular chaperone HtpG [Pseudomonadota bacterium]
MSFSAQAETLSFEAEVKQLLNLVAHSLYSNPEIFLRELVSNSSDAADKLRYAALTDSALYENDSQLKIWVDINKQNRTITVRDNGIGMSREEVIENLGTIAKSGTRAFKEMLENKQAGGDSQLIGQFGVGFYSTFVVADHVVVRTRRAGMKADQGVMWESDGQGQYNIKNIQYSPRGTEVVLHLKQEFEEFLDEYRIRNVITKYSDHIVLPIIMKKPDISKKDEIKQDKEAIQEKEIVIPEEEVINRASALWTLSKNEISDDQYKELYKHIGHDFEDPLAWTHNKLEGKLEYTSLLYIPARAPFDLWQREGQRGLKLYVKRVFIMDDAEHFMPMYLRFVKGIVDSNDLPLNISREILQQSNKIVEKIRSGLVKRVLDLLEKLATDDQAAYRKFWQEFGMVLKEGPGEDYANKDRIAKLLRFASTHQEDNEQTVSLIDYVARMPKEQDKIYYLIADSYLTARHSPLLEVFRKKGIEVLLLVDKVDEWLMSHLFEFEGKKFQSISKGKLDIDNIGSQEEKQQQEAKAATFTEVVESVQKALGDQVKEVRLTHRLVDSPCCVVFDENELSGHMQRLLKAAGQAVPESKPILELNPDHQLLLKLQHIKDPQKISDWSEILLNQALIAEGEQLKNPVDFIKRLNQMLAQVAE